MVGICVNILLFSTHKGGVVVVVVVVGICVNILLFSTHTREGCQKAESTNPLFYCLLICIQMCDVSKLVQQHL